MLGLTGRLFQVQLCLGQGELLIRECLQFFLAVGEPPFSIVRTFECIKGELGRSLVCPSLCSARDANSRPRMHCFLFECKNTWSLGLVKVRETRDVEGRFRETLAAWYISAARAHSGEGLASQTAGLEEEVFLGREVGSRTGALHPTPFDGVYTRVCIPMCAHTPSPASVP